MYIIHIRYISSLVTSSGNFVHWKPFNETILNSVVFLDQQSSALCSDNFSYFRTHEQRRSQAPILAQLNIVLSLKVYRKLLLNQS